MAEETSFPIWTTPPDGISTWWWNESVFVDGSPTSWMDHKLLVSFSDNLDQSVISELCTTS